MPIDTNNITKSYVDTQKLQLPLTQFNNNQCPFDTISNNNSMIAVALRQLAFLLILFCISPIDRRQIWTPTSQDQHFLGLRVPLYTGATPFPSVAKLHKTIRAKETPFAHPSPPFDHELQLLRSCRDRRLFQSRPQGLRDLGISGPPSRSLHRRMARHRLQHHPRRPIAYSGLCQKGQNFFRGGLPEEVVRIFCIGHC